MIYQPLRPPVDRPDVQLVGRVAAGRRYRLQLLLGVLLLGVLLLRLVLPATAHVRASAASLCVWASRGKGQRIFQARTNRLETGRRHASTFRGLKKEHLLRVTEELFQHCVLRGQRFLQGAQADGFRLDIVRGCWMSRCAALQQHHTNAHEQSLTNKRRLQLKSLNLGTYLGLCYLESFTYIVRRTVLRVYFHLGASVFTFSVASLLSLSVSSATRSSLSWSFDFWRARYRRCAIRLASRGLHKPHQSLNQRCRARC